MYETRILYNLSGCLTCVQDSEYMIVRKILLIKIRERDEKKNLQTQRCATIEFNNDEISEKSLWGEHYFRDTTPGSFSSLVNLYRYLIV